MGKFFYFHSKLTIFHQVFTTYSHSSMKSLASTIDSKEVASRAVGDVSEKDHRKKEFFEEKGCPQSKYESDETTELGLGLPINVFKARIRDAAYHKKCNGQHEGRD